MPAERLTLHLTTSDGQPFTVQIPAPTVRPAVTVRVNSLTLAAIQAISRYDGTTWQPIGAP